ncbi:MAG TPA: type II secretion system F family protein [Candidatus Binataceae bacterium]|nr:type II secretion system F family protein [Candidatus Binataceae bacterium]
MSALYITLSFVLLSAAALTAVYAALFGSPRVLDERITDMVVKTRVSYRDGDFVAEGESSRSRALFRWVAQRLPQPRNDSPQAEKIVRLLMQAGYMRSSAARTFHVLRIASTAAGAIAALLTALATDRSGGMAIMMLAAGAGIGAFIPSYLLGRKARQRQRAIAQQLSDVLDLLVVCVEAGLGLSEAIKVVGSEAERQGQAIGTELALVSGELAAGSSLGQALRQFADRTAVEDIKPLAATLIQSEQIGAQIGPTLRSISDSMRSARRMRAEEAAQKTTVKILFPLVLFVLPAMMSVIVGPAMIQIMQTLSK